MTDEAVQSIVTVGTRPANRASALAAFKLGDTIFRWLTLAAAIAVLLILGSIIISLIIGAWPSISTFGIAFLWTPTWNAPRQLFGALVPIIGTLITAAIAMIIAIPVGLGIAIFLTEFCPPVLKRPIGIAIELLAGIPSIIYGIWGFFVLAPAIKNLIDASGDIPILSDIFGNATSGSNIFTASLVLSIMILPFITAISRDVFDTVPAVLKEAAFGIGCTTKEVVSNVVIPYTRVGLIGGGMLALGRALGETMAVTFVIGSNYRIPTSLWSGGTTISATIANEYAESSGLFKSALTELGLILFVITFIVLSCARLMLMRLEKQGAK